MENETAAIRQSLENIYGKEKGDVAYKAIAHMLGNFPRQQLTRGDGFSEKDTILITYGDSLNDKETAPLEVLHRFAAAYLKDSFSGIHILPFFPYSSDDGFSVIDFLAVDPHLGTWEHIHKLGSDFRLMFDLVLNHISAKSNWYQRFLDGDKGYADIAIEIDDTMDISRVVRPRALPLYIDAKKKTGEISRIWTTFSADQIDLNYKSIDLLKHMVGVLLDYIRNGADIIRLDAIAYLWKESGTSCIHLPQTHEMVRLLRAILDVTAPGALIITETNVPHRENISYFGNGENEAQLVYNFTLPPMLLYTFIKEDARMLSQWAKDLVLESSKNTFFNFTASHDGIGVRPLEGILPAEEIDLLASCVKENHGLVSMYQSIGNEPRPYELNIAYVDALGKAGKEDPRMHIRRFLASQAIQYALPGVPATYIHSLLGTRNWLAGVEMTGRARTINREKLQVAEVISEIEDSNSFRSRIMLPYLEMVSIRRKQRAFHPSASFEILDLSSRVFAIERRCDKQRILALTNISSAPVSVLLPYGKKMRRVFDLLSGSAVEGSNVLLQPYQYVWLNIRE